MPDIHLRFHKDVLVLFAPPEAALRARGFDTDIQSEVLLATEPETILEPLRLNMLAGAQCLVLPTAGITRARLAHMRAEDSAPRVADAALDIASELTPQHILAEIGPTGLPLDITSKTSLTANRDQYADAARLFPAEAIDAIFLNNMASVDDMRCALMGVRKVCDAPLFASMRIDAEGKVEGRAESIEDLLALLEEYGANVAGIQMSAPPDAIIAVVERMKAASDLPILVQLDVAAVHARDPHDNSPYWCAELCLQAALALQAAGVQFLRATGAATAAYTGALAAATTGLDVRRSIDG